MNAHTPCRLPLSRRRGWREVTLVWRGGWARLRTRLWLVVVVAVIGIGLSWVATEQDAALLAKARLNDNQSASNFAAFVSNFASDLTLGAPLSLVLWCIGVRRSKARWRRLGLACLMATLMAGLLITVIKVVAGRPRPYVAEQYPQPLYGPTFKPKLHSFPSGHTATSTATGVSWIAANPVMAVPGIAYAATVGWSRMQLRRHYPIDVAGGAAIGIICGLCFGSTVPGSSIRLRRNKRRHPAAKTP